MNTKTILIVDDSDLDRELMSKALSVKGGFHILKAATGEECLKILDEEKVDLILMDILMPGVLGNQVLVKIRERSNPVELPIIMVTVKSDPADIINCFAQGANDYITKPIHFDIAIHRILTHLTLSELSKDMSDLKEISALNSMIATYNHEINNPLTIAMGCMDERLLRDPAVFNKLKTSLNRISEIVRKIKDVAAIKGVHYRPYTGVGKIIKVNE